MKPEFEEIQPIKSRSFLTKVVKRDNRPLLTQAWHYHPQIEICYTLKSHGLRYVGNNISDYKERDLVVLGSNLPHGFTTTDRSEQYVIQFMPDFLGDGFFSVAELRKVQVLLDQSKRGLALTASETKKAETLIMDLYEPELSEMKRLLALLRFLDFLSASNGLESICSDKYSASISVNKLSKLKAIFDYIENNFQSQISIEEACRTVNLTESAFYKFIKRHTNKKFTTIVNEYRMDHVSKLLVSGDKPISEVSVLSGFNNLSYFNKIFKQTYRQTPRQFRIDYKHRSENEVAIES